ncbi:hypothetical protein BRYFOR_06159 [Marvinbryantia formatexigens DSM 14469]|uniref:Uncharacterized protein n=1 Tax=Marvinbryantia formatexigens DSM 14469 TaxID=478749 RepID=C6LC12_9FIRM|nr:hypothetical protein [Marvinbryantia formatexigens]EET61965.1 hypothetical protein BRYFOR_06159 [Marvinbryantia formatexigens DSM 14469]UWO25704.1 hypothetical protein NQ534_04280 [Marvinbryantia formatexigens DSM 14469]SDF33369.1 hypothetical protein SAMN05660368_00496 [Marvinbryantia formatexigens]
MREILLLAVVAAAFVIGRLGVEVAFPDRRRKERRKFRSGRK